MLIALLSDLHVRSPGRPYREIVDSDRMLRDAIDRMHRLDRAPVPILFLTSP